MRAALAGRLDDNALLNQGRNLITAASILATAGVVGSTTLIKVLTDPAAMEAIRAYARSDPVSGCATAVPPEVKVGAGVVALLASFFSLAQALRLQLHFHHFVAAAKYAAEAPGEYDHAFVVEMRRGATATLLRGQAFFSLGLRLLYAFLPLLLWSLGATYLLAGSAALTATLYRFDHV